jgi:hypothetical protein
LIFNPDLLDVNLWIPGSPQTRLGHMRQTRILALAMLVAAISAPLWAAPQAAVSGQAAKSALPFVENDYAKALADAQKRNVPIFVEAWAPW